jgi:hypothetical protein
MSPTDILNSGPLQVPTYYYLMMSGLLLWSLAWKGLAMWKAAHKDHKIWFGVLLVVNTMGILDILYIYILSDKNISFKMRDKKPDPAPKSE